MMHTEPATLEALAFFAGGVVGCACRAAISKSQDFYTRKTVADLIIGGLTGIIYPVIAPIPIPSSAHANIIQQAAFVALVSYFVDHLLQNYFGQRIAALVAKPPEDSKP